MPPRRGNRGPQHDDDSSSDDEDEFFRGRITFNSSETGRSRLVDGVEVTSWPTPTRLWPYSYITGPWKNLALSKGIGDRRLKSFLQENYLVNGSDNGGIQSHWSGRHEFWKATIATTGVRSIFFSDRAVNELIDLLADQVIQTPKSAIKPDAAQALKVATDIVPGSLASFHPETAAQLTAEVDKAVSEQCKYEHQRSKTAWAEIESKGGSIVAFKTQRFEGRGEGTADLALEVGWSTLEIVRDTSGTPTEISEQRHFIIEENEGYRNGVQLPDNRKQFGFGQTETKPEADIAAAFTQVLVRLSARGPVLLVFHDFPSEKYYCQQQGYSTANWIEFIPPQLYVRGSCHGAAERGFGQHYPIIVQDTQRLFGAFQPGQLGLTTALSRTCAYFRVRGTRMNNAGNDAYYLLQVFDNMLAGQP